MLDDSIFQTLGKRMEMSKKIGQYKKDNNVMVLQLNRWEEILQKRVLFGQAMGLREDFSKKLLELVHEESINLQTEIMNG
jgi:chorismate mutase